MLGDGPNSDVLKNFEELLPGEGIEGLFEV